MKTFLILLFFVSSLTLMAQSDTNRDFHLDKEYTIGSQGTLTLKCSDAKVTINGTARNTARVKIDREVETKGIVFGGHDEFNVEVEEQNGNLKVYENKSYSASGIVGYYREKYSININLPEGTSLVIKGDDGDYRIDNVNGSISVDLDDADVELTACSGSDFKFAIDDGDIVMDQGKGRLDIDADDADVRISNGAFTFIQADIDDGDLVIETSLVDTGSYYINAQDGLIALTVTNGGGKFDIRHDDARIITEGKFQTIEESENRTRLTLPLGSAKVDIRADDARVRLVGR
ncbi:MAG: DUF4097 family beta strand repeat protein [Bacteroidia bacterium]|nr:DUF4097 family beta strand repeat protein [Bacteroidia bacterium]